MCRAHTHPRHDDSLDVPEDVIPRLRLLGSLARDKLAHVPRLDVREHAPLADVFEVVSDVFDHLVAYKMKKIHLLELMFIFSIKRKTVIINFQR
jgi:hypothetical protein